MKERKPDDYPMLRLCLRILPLLLCLICILCVAALTGRFGTTATALVYSQFEAGTGRYFVYVDAARGIRVPLGNALHDLTAVQGRPVSPDGRTYVSTRPTANGVDLFVIESGESVPRRLTRWDAFATGEITGDMRSNTYPVWSPDGQWIAFISSDSSAQMDIYLIRPDGNGIRRLVADVGTPTPLEMRWGSFQERPFEGALILVAAAIVIMAIYPKLCPLES